MPPTNGGRALDDNDLQAALQLLVERAQYVTGATGAALALLEGDEMVCRASTGRSAPAVGATLQVRSGLTGESMARRQLLRCDHAESDPRVNLEACRELGIASIVVMPLLARNGEARGLFELFSDHPYAFEERDLIALERMAELTRTALDLQTKITAGPLGPASESSTGTLAPDGVIDETASDPGGEVRTADPSPPVETAGTIVPPLVPALSALASIPALDQVQREPAAEDLASGEQGVAPSPTTLPEAMRRVHKCASCGFPVSEGRSLCLDCEKKEGERPEPRKMEPAGELALGDGAPTDAGTLPPAEFVPAFLANAVPQKPSWLADHVNLLAVVVLILCVLVAIVVFR